MQTNDVFSQREAILLGAAAMTIAAAATVLLTRVVTLDDAYITFRYARHFAEGYGLGAWNRTGEHVEGYSSLFWTLLLGGAARLSFDVRIASKVFAAVAALSVIAVLFRRREDRPAMLAGVFLALYAPFVFYAASGMEAVIFTSLVTLAVVGPPAWQPIVAPLLIATRPEGALVAGLDVLSLAWRRTRRRWIFATALASGLTFMGITIHRWVMYRALAPNTYYAKVAGGGIGHVLLGVTYVGTWALAHLVVVIVLAIGAVTLKRTGDRRGLMCLALLFAYIAYIVMAGGDPPSAFPGWRHLVHIAPAWVLVAMTGLTRIVRDRRWRQVAAAAGLALVSNAGVLIALGREGPRPGIADYFAWIASLASPTTTISSSYGGALPFMVDAVHIDALGLNTPYIARHGTFDPEGPQDSKTDMRWVIEQRPDIIEGYLSGRTLLKGPGAGDIIGPRRRKMILEMVSSPRFQREYVFVRNAPYDRLDGLSFCGATSGKLCQGATSSTASRLPRPLSLGSEARDLVPNASIDRRCISVIRSTTMYRVNDLQSRRAFLRAAIAASAAWAAADILEVEDALAFASQQAGATSAASTTTLTPTQAEVVAALTSRILPSVDGRPGAREVGAVYFIDRALATFNASQRSLYVAGIADLDRRAQAKVAGSSGFAALAAAQQDDVIREVETTAFFQAARFDTIVGTFALPVWGGNRDYMGWHLLGVEHQMSFRAPFGYYDAEINEQK